MFNKKNRFKKQAPTQDKFKEPQFYTQNGKVYEVAIVIDGKVEEIMRAEVRLAALLLSEPAFVDITDMGNRPYIGYLYNEETQEFKENNEI